MKMFFRGNTDYKKIIFLSLLAVQAIVLALVEAQLPFPGGIPGIKPGLANMITVVGLIFFSLCDTALIVLVRCITATLFVSGPILFIFSAAGGMLGAVVMWLLLKYAQRFFSLIGISIAGAVAHNAAQILVACFIMSDLSVMSYLPVLLTWGIFMGVFTGVCSTFMVKILKKLNFIANI
ncbi:heptaprenyl diphosphate synthase component I [Ruminiclostridium hungatei]|uniref:Heptaprenyl diphosphate synthase component I n=1 Tax=Ruminiclostridium hungatei TaxID=48256 RepID=A0A1V4SF30_RUMHU|nr:Gx transporter family protein [Ruminiclostridium hungatei]OPX42343.1 heptaprenyl diphosphate synthase component I [Ruminiclostridium hungatei]